MAAPTNTSSIISPGTGWTFDQFNDGTLKIVGEIQQKKFSSFLESYASQLKGMQDALGQSIGNSWDFTLDPVSLELVAYEQSSLLGLIRNQKFENKVLNKVLTVLATLCQEVSELKHEAENNFYNALLFYGEGEPECGLEEGEAQVQMGRLLPLLQDLSSFVRRCREVTKHFVDQLSGLYTDVKSPNHVIDMTGVHFLVVFDSLGELLQILIILDEIILNHSQLKEHWTCYRRMLKSVQHNPTMFGMDAQRLLPFEKLTLKLQGELLEGTIYQNCVEQSFGSVSTNALLQEEFSYAIKSLFTVIEPKLGEQDETDERMKYVSVCGLYVLHFHIFRVLDKRLFRSIWDVYKKVPGITLLGNVIWFANDFLVLRIPQIPKLLDKKSISAPITQKTAYLQQQSVQLPRDIQACYMKVCAWMVRMESLFTKSSGRAEECNKRSILFLQGIKYAYSISNLLRTTMNLHANINQPLKKTSLLTLFHLVEMLKAIQHTVHRRSIVVSDSVFYTIQRLQLVLLNIINSAKSRILSDKKLTDKRTDVLSALVMAENVMNGPVTKERVLICKLAMSVATQLKCLKDEEFTTFNSIMRRLEALSSIKSNVSKACDCSFIYWHRDLMPTYLTALLDDSADPHRIHYVSGALRDCVPPMMSTVHLSTQQQLVDCFQTEIMNDIKKCFLDVLSKRIEEDLRLAIHTHLKLDDRNPFRRNINDLSPFLQVKPVRFLEKFIDIKAHVTHYLEKTFYNLTTVALQDWKTYGEMRNLASQKYNLTLNEGKLPSQTLEQGLDVLEIMKNINIFVSRYLYNLNNQIFVERTSKNKHLNTINIRHVANSIRTHGIGIMNTTVNFTYQFLHKKFVIFSQFMYDEHIKARLIKDMRYFKENHSETDNKYPYERADKFNRGIRKLGLTPEGLSYLDQFRNLISQIGNAMGYVRMMRSGGLHCCGNAIRFIPDLEDIITFEDSALKDGLSTESIQAAKQLDSVISNLYKNFSEGSDYFKILVDVFSAEFRSNKNVHLRYFYFILPPMIVNYVEYSISCKEKMNKKNKVGAAFTDDGFAMGVAYILKLLNQYHEFDSLHFFHSVRDKYTTDRENVHKEQSSVSGRDDEKLQQTMDLTLKRLSNYQHEFHLLNFSLSSARIFFRGSKSDPEETKEQSGGVQSTDSNSSTTEPTPTDPTQAGGAAAVPASGPPPPPPPPM